MEDTSEQTHELSVEAFSRLVEERTDLTGRGRVDIARRIEEARLMGDLSENGDYHAAKEEQGKMEGRITFLNGLLSECVVKVAASEHATLTGELEGLREPQQPNEPQQPKEAARAALLDLLLKHAVLVADDEHETSAHVSPGAIIELRFAGDETAERYLFGSVEERRDGLDVVSPHSPLGQQLNGAAAGDEVTFDAGAGPLTVEVVSIER